MNTQELMKNKGRTFYWASRFLPSDEAMDISILYSFCRFVDDLVDEKGESCVKILHQLERGESSYPEVKELLDLASRRTISLEMVKILLNTLEKDQKGMRIQTWGELLCYCYGVASTVGLMMCDIFRVKERSAHPFAIDLGIAMQLTNIARDIVEDTKNNKIYLPQEAFRKEMTLEEIGLKSRQEEVLGVQEKILSLADKYYESAEKGIPFLPSHARLTILVASRLYQAKGETIRKNPTYHLNFRADVPFFRKIRHTLKACYSLYFQSEKERKHDPKLHRDLFSLPGVHEI